MEGYHSIADGTLSISPGPVAHSSMYESPQVHVRQQRRNRRKMSTRGRLKFSVEKQSRQPHFSTNQAKIGTGSWPLFSLTCPPEKRYSLRVNTNAVAAYRRHPSSEASLEHPVPKGIVELAPERRTAINDRKYRIGDERRACSRMR